MIKGLLKKDLYNLAAYKTSIIIMVLFCGIAIIGSKAVIYGPIIICTIVGMIALSTFNYDETAKSNKYILTLPTNRKEIVKSKFILSIGSAIVGGIIGIIITILVVNIMNYIKPEDMINIDYKGLIVSTIGGMFGIALIQSIQIPSIYKWGAEKGRIQMFILVFGIVSIVSGIAFLLIKMNITINIEIIENILNNYGMFLLIAVIALMYFISYKISCKVYNKKKNRNCLIKRICLSGGKNIMYKILIIEDDIEIREELKILLQNSGYEVETITDFKSIEKQVFEIDSHLILLDINLPEKSGYEICSKIRAKSKIPIIFVTSRNSSMDELKGIMIGGDDYIEKPYNVPILLARIQNLLNRTYSENNQKESKIEFKGITLDILKSQIQYKEKTIELTKTEVKTIYYLFKNRDRIIPRTEIIDYLWDNEVYADDNSLSVIITRVREKLKEIGVNNLIETKRGQGYKL